MRILLIALLALALGGCSTVPSSHTVLQGVEIDPVTNQISIMRWESGKDVSVALERDGNGNLTAFSLNSQTNAGAFKAFADQQKTVQDAIAVGGEAVKRIPLPVGP